MASIADEIKRRVDIVDVVREYVKLKKQGPRYVGLCPFHTEKTPSFGIKDQFFKCFGCDAKGSVIDFLMLIEGCTFREACERLAEQYNAVMPERVRRDPIKRRIVELEQAGKVTEALKMAEKLRVQE